MASKSEMWFRRTGGSMGVMFVVFIDGGQGLLVPILWLFGMLCFIFLFATLFVFRVMVLEEAEVVTGLPAADIEALVDLWHFGVDFAINIVIFRIEVPALGLGD